MERDRKSSASSLRFAFSLQVSGRAIQSPTKLPHSWDHGAQGCMRICWVTVLCFISLVLDSWALRVFLGFCFSKPYCIEFPHTCIMSHIRKHIHKVNSYKWLYLVNAYAYILTVTAKLLFIDSVLMYTLHSHIPLSLLPWACPTQMCDSALQPGKQRLWRRLTITAYCLSA